MEHLIYYILFIINQLIYILINILGKKLLKFTHQSYLIYTKIKIKHWRNKYFSKIISYY